MHRITLFLIVLLLPFAAQARMAEVAFLEIHDPKGKRLELEPGHRFGHVAIRVGDQWLHAYPYHGVTLIDDLGKFGRVYVRLRHPHLSEPAREHVHYWLGKPFDYCFSWTNPVATYCSRLIANLLGIPPKPMEFGAEFWEIAQGKAPKGEPGLSPDDLFQELLRQGFKPVSCADLLQ